MEWRRLLAGSLLCGAVLFAVGAAFHLLVPLAAPRFEAEYANEALFRSWEGWTRNYMLVHPWGFGAVFAGVFLGARSVVGRGNLGGMRDGALYGLAVFLVGALPVFALNFASFQVSGEVISAWALQSLAQYVSAGLMLGWVFPRAERRRFSTPRT